MQNRSFELPRIEFLQRLETESHIQQSFTWLQACTLIIIQGLQEGYTAVSAAKKFGEVLLPLQLACFH